ncbi:MAG: hypothetical protein Fues2KO_54000 [Fuerstiella sp.]
MISRLHCTDGDLQQLLTGELPSDRSGDLTVHLEACATCQARLERMSETDVSVDAAGSFLREDTIDQELLPVDQELSDADLAFLKPSDDPKSIGRFARFEIVELLGRGGMSIVMRGFDASLNRFCAVKVLSPELASSAAARRRFSREAKSAAAVVHPHVVPIHSVDEEDGLPFLVMPVVEGRSLEERVRQTGPLEVIEVVRIAAQVAEGLAAAHAQGLVHRDIKPGNVLLENGVERVQLTDFGLARAADDASMTRSGVIAGTPQYMSPEQAHGDAIDHRSDLFSLGGLIYFMCTGRSPFRAETTMGVLNRIANDEPRRLRDINPDVPMWLEDFVLTLLNKSADDRPQSAQEVAEQLQQRLVRMQVPDSISTDETVELLPATSSTASAASAGTTTRQTADGLNDRDRNGAGGRIAMWIAAAAFFAVLMAVIVLETGKGTIRIRTNAKGEVPVRILKGNKVVDELTVSTDGASTRVAAGEYVIQVDGPETEYEIVGAAVKLTRGGEWIATIEERPSVRQAATGRDDASKITEVAVRELATEFLQAFADNRFDDALKLMAPEPADRLADREKWNKAKDFAAQLKISGGDVNIAGNLALVSFDEVQPEGSDASLVPGVILKKVAGTWGVQDMDFISPENARKEAERWASGIPTPESTSTTNRSAADDANAVPARPADVEVVQSDSTQLPPIPPGGNMTDKLLRTLSGITKMEARISAATLAVERSPLPDGARASMAISVGTYLCKQLFPDKPLEAFIAVRSGGDRNQDYAAMFESTSVRDEFRRFVDTAAVVMSAAMLTRPQKNDVEFNIAALDTEDDQRAAFILGVISYDAASVGRNLILEIVEKLATAEKAKPMRLLAWGHLSSILSQLRSPYPTLITDGLNQLGSELAWKDSGQINADTLIMMHEWVTLAEPLNLDQITTAQLVLAIYLADEQSDRFRSFNVKPEYAHPYNERRTAVRRNFKFFESRSQYADPHWKLRVDPLPPNEAVLANWPLAANAVLEVMVKQRKVTAEEIRLVRSLESVLLALSPPDTKAHLNKTAELLKTRLREYYSTSDAAPVGESWQQVLPVSPERMLALICLCEGQIPDFVVNGRPAATVARRNLAEYRRVMNSGLKRSDVQIAEDTISDVLEHAPYHAIGIATTAGNLPQDVDRIQALYAAMSSFSQFPGIVTTTAPTEPLLILTALGQIIDDAVDPGIGSRAESTLAEYLTTARYRRLLNIHLKAALDDTSHVGQLTEDLLVRIHRIAKTPKLKTTIAQFDSRIANRLSADSDPTPMATTRQTHPAEDELLFNGLKQSEWERRFKAETNPVAKIEAGQALVELSSGLQDAERVPRLMQIAGELVREGFGPQPKTFLATSLRYNISKLYPTRWSVQSYPELKTAWQAFTDSIEQVCEALPPKVLAESMASIINEAAPTEAAFATILLNKLKNTYGAGTEPTDALLQIRRAELEPYLSHALMEYEDGASPAVIDEFRKHCTAICQQLANEELDRDGYAIAQNWCEHSFDEEVSVPSDVRMRLVLQLLLTEPKDIWDDFFRMNLSSTSELAYPATRTKNARSSNERNNFDLMWAQWIPFAIDWLKDNPAANAEARYVLGTLHTPLLMRSADDDWPMEELIAVLEQRIDRYVKNRPTAPGAESLHDLLSFLILAGGDLPEVLLTQELPGDDQKLQLFANQRQNQADQQHEVLNRALKPLKGLQATHPVAVARLAINYNEDFHYYRPLSMILAVSSRSNEHGSPPPMEPLLLLAVAAELTGQTEIIDRNIASMFGHRPVSFSGHIEDAVDYPFAIREVATRLLGKMLDRALDQQLIEVVGKLVPGEARDRDIFIKSNPDSLIAITEEFNEQSRDKRTTLFDPPIPELNVAKVKAALLDAADGHEKVGDTAIAAALRESVKMGRLADGLERAGVMGTSQKDSAGEETFRQILPSLQWKTGPKSYKAIILDEIELRWSRDGWKSPGYGQIHPPLDGIWALKSVEQDGEPLADDALFTWLTDHHALRRLVIKDESVKLLPPQRNERQPETLPPPTAPIYDLRLYYDHSPPRFSMFEDRGAKQVEVYRGLFMGSGFVDNQTLKLVLAPDTTDWPTRFTSEGTDSTKLVYERIETEDVPLKPVPKVDEDNTDSTNAPTTEMSAEQSASANATVQLQVAGDGSLMLNGKASDSDGWRAHLQKLKSQDGKVDIKLKVAATIPFQAVQKLIDEAKETLGDQFGKVSLIAVAPADGTATESAMMASPESPLVKIAIRDTDGQPRTDVHVTLRSTGRNAKPLEVEEHLSDEQPIFSRVLPYGEYYLIAVTSDGWRGTMGDVKVEFGKGLNLQVTSPKPDQWTTVALDAHLNFDAIPHYDTLPFGNLEWHQGSSRGFFPQSVNPPNEDQEQLESFPTPADGIQETGVRIRIQLQQELPASNDDTCTWRWKPDNNEPSLLLFRDGLHVVQDTDYGRTQTPDDEGYFKVGSGSTRYPRVGYSQYTLSASQPYPHQLRVPAGQLEVLLVGLIGKPTDEVMERLLGDQKDKVAVEGAEFYLAPDIDKESPWIQHLFDTEDGQWKPMVGGGYFHLLRREFNLQANQPETITLRTAQHNPEPQDAAAVEESVD